MPSDKVDQSPDKAEKQPSSTDAREQSQTAAAKGASEVYGSGQSPGSDSRQDKADPGQDARAASEAASAKAASEVYGSEKQSSASGGDSDDWLWSTRQEDWQKVDEKTYKSKDGDTWKVVDEQTEKSLFSDWDSIFSWSRGEAKQETEKSNESGSLFNFDWDDVLDLFSWGGKKEKGQDGQKPPSEKDMSDEELAEFLYKEMSAPGKGEAKQAKDNGDFHILPDGTKVSKDLSQVELSDKSARAFRDAAPDQPVVHTFKDKDGKEVRLEIKQGQVTHINPDGTRTEVSKDRIKIDSAGTTTEIDRNSKEISAASKEIGVQFHQDTQEGVRTVHTKDGTTISYTQDKVLVKKPDGSEREFTREEFLARFRGRGGKMREIVLQAASPKEGEAEEPPTNVKDINIGKFGIAIRDQDGTLIRVKRDGKVAIKSPDGSEILIDEHGKARLKTKDGELVSLTKDHLPPGCTMDDKGRIHLKSGLIIGVDRRITTSRGDEVNAATGEVTAKDEAGNKYTLSATTEGGTMRAPDGSTTSTNTSTGEVKTIDHEGREELTWKSQTGELNTEHVTMTREQTVLWNGDVVKLNGEVQTHNGTHYDEDGHIHFADGTWVDEKGHVHSGDGEEWFCDGEAGGGPKTPSQVADFAAGLAASIAGKGEITSSDLAALHAVLGQIGALLPALTDCGCLGAVARLKDAEGHVLEAIGRAQKKETKTAG